MRPMLSQVAQEYHDESVALYTGPGVMNAHLVRSREEIGMTTVIVVTGLILAALLAAVIVGIRVAMRFRGRMQNAFADGMRQGAAEPGAESVVRGAGGLTAAQTTAMANNALNALTGRRPNRADGVQAHTEPNPSNEV